MYISVNRCSLNYKKHISKIRTLPLDLIPLIKHRKTIIHDNKRQSGRSYLKPPRSPISPSPSVIFNTYRSQNWVVELSVYVQLSVIPNLGRHLKLYMLISHTVTMSKNKCYILVKVSPEYFTILPFHTNMRSWSNTSFRVWWCTVFIGTPPLSYNYWCTE